MSLHPAPPESLPAGTPESPAAGAGVDRVIEGRMLTLKTLHDKKLITDEEYEAKRKEILKDL